MFENGARYNSIGPWLKNFFGERTAKVSVDGGFTCPNRDGTLGYGGCIFCSELGSGDFSGAGILPQAVSALSGPQTQSRQLFPIGKQIDIQIGALRRKWGSFRCIAYFQNFTNTYAPVDVLKEKYEEALSHPMCSGIAIATRPDCLGEEIVSLLSELNRQTFLWVELGLQTSDEETAVRIRRGYPLSVYDDAVSRLTAENIRVVTHLIAGLPGEDEETFLRSVRHTASGGIFGIKLQLLHILRHTALGAQWLSQAENGGTMKENFSIRPLEKEEYIRWISDALEQIPEEITIHRLTGDAPKPLLLAPRWSLDKRSVLNGINQELKRRDSFQGIRCPR